MLLAAGALLGEAQQPVSASEGPGVVRPDDRRIAYEGHWGITDEAAITVNSGSRLGVRFSGPVSFGRQGVPQTGNGGVPDAADSYGWNYAGSSAGSDRRADVIVVNQGTNDALYGSAEFRAAYRAYLARLRAAAPHARILALRPFNGTHADDIAAVVAELADARTEFVDTTDWLSPADGDFNGTVHPSAQGHRKVAARLLAVLGRPPRPTAPSITTPEGAASRDEHP
ncbi:hypothetical protein GCM10022403_093740 [Streptomyces coacervatus]|uniref:SGNH hydrolase-type esterase domain-containing protein n=1 Tax=Streptomyces coacervatus TaxID=647381 RepID=A0ABP7JKR5_9ACTN|nr:GDSL-type esterase/lipase family protein [Streptomyces coacervatus]MDF2264476.1 GDSL-type esterase/lipase family protein [Streptomyces coacervatus]